MAGAGDLGDRRLQDPACGLRRRRATSSTTSSSRPSTYSEGVAALTLYADLMNGKKVTPPGTTSASWDNVATSFSDGLTAMTMNYHDLSLSPSVKGSVAYAVIPMGKSIGPHFGTWMLSVNSFSKNKEWAFRAIQWFTSAATQTKALAHQLHPTRVSVYEAAIKDPAIGEKFANFYDVLGKSLAVGVGRPRLTNYGDVADRAIWVNAVNDAARGAATPEAALKARAGRCATCLRRPDTRRNDRYGRE